MDIEGICSDLQSLRKLYGLLRNDGQGLPNESSEGLSVPTDKLDQQARLLLRDLLDAAAERIFKAHAKILAVRRSVDTSCSSQQGKSKYMLKLLPPLFLKNASRNSGSVLQSTCKNIDTQKEVSERDKWVPIEPTGQVDSSEQSRLKIFGSEPQVRKKRCRVCLRSSLKQPKVLDWRIQYPNKRMGVQTQLHNPSFEFHAGDLLVEGKMSSIKAMNSANGIETQRQKGSFEHQSSPVDVGRESACSSGDPATDIVESGDLHNFAADPERKSEEPDKVSKEASIKIQLIESSMSALQEIAKPAHNLQIQNGAAYGWNDLTSISNDGSESVSSMLQRKKRLVTRNEVSEVGDFAVGRSDPKSRPLGRRVWEPTQWHQVPNQVRKTKLSNKLNSRILKPLPPSGAVTRQTMTETVDMNKHIAFEYDRSSEVRNPIEGCRVPDQEESHPGKNAKAIIDRIESLSQVTCRDDHTPMQTNKFILGLRLPANQNRITSTDFLLPAKLQSQLAKENLDRNRTRLKKTIPIVETSLSSNWNKMVNSDLILPEKLQNKLEKENLDQNQTTLKKKFPIVETSESLTPSVGSKFIMRHASKLQAGNVGSKLNRTRTKAPTLITPHRMTGQALPDHKSTQFRVSPTSHEDRPNKGQGSFQERTNRVGTWRFISPSQEVSESSSSRSHYSSSWQSQQVSTSFSDDDGYSVPGQTGTGQSSDLSTSSKSVVYSHHGRTGARKVIYSSSNSELYSVSSRSQGHQLDSDSSSESQEYLLPNRSPVHGHIGSLHQSVGSTSRSMDLGNSSRLLNRPQVGRLKKLKDKLAIIFHHHHHHHHHHHNHGDDDNQHIEVRGGKSLWMHAGKIFDKRSKAEAYGEQGVKKIRKSAGSAQDKNQRGHFHTLVEGLLQHVRHSKKSKVAKGGIARPGNGQHGAKKKVKKLHWWQMLQHQKGLKMPKKPRGGTLGVGRKNPKLKALPKPR